MPKKKGSKVNFENMPAELKRCKKWIGLDFVKNDEGKKTIVKRHMVKHHKINDLSRDECVYIEDCMEHAHEFDAIGFRIAETDPYIVWRLKKCCDKKTGKINNNVKYILDRLKTYTEYSRNGKGLNVIVKGNIGPLGRKNKRENIEVFERDKFLIITGNRVVGYPKNINSRKRICADLHETYFSKQIENALKKSENIFKWINYKKIYPFYYYD